MKFVSFLLKGQAKFGITDGNNITDLTGKIKGAQTLKELIINKSIQEAKEFSKKKPRKNKSGGNRVLTCNSKSWQNCLCWS